MTEFYAHEVQQTDLFVPLPNPYRERLMRTHDAINRANRSGTMRLG
jgi:hypothetical protein